MVTTRMRTASLFMALAVWLSFAATLAVKPAHACSCAGTGDAEEELRRSDAVFSGEVVEVGELSTAGQGPMDPGMPFLAPVTFDVKGAWKGVTGDSVVVHGQGPGVSCGLNFEPGETYLVFAGGSGEDGGGKLQTDLCSATRLASEETARNMFGPPMDSLPETGGVSSEGTADSVGQTRIAAIAALVLLAAGTLIAGRAVIGPGR